MVQQIKKITSLLESKCAVNILIDTRATFEDVNKIFQSNKLKWKLGHFKHQGTYTPARGIIIIYEKNLVKVKDLKIIQQGQLLSFKVKINNDWINFTSVYALPENDNLEFFLITKEALDEMEGDLGLICGDFNTTLNIKDERYGYTTDTHKKMQTHCKLLD